METDMIKTNRAEHRPFLSHQWLDKGLVRRVADALIARGMEPILDILKFVPGDSLTKSMANAIKDSTSFVLFWSKHAVESKNVEYERELALVEMRKQSGFRVICVLLDETPPPDELSYRLYIDWRTGKRRGKRFEENVDTLYRAICGLPPANAGTNSKALEAFNRAKALLLEYEGGLILYERVFFTTKDVQAAFPNGFTALAELQKLLGYNFLWRKSPGDDLRLLASREGDNDYTEICRLRVDDAWNGVGRWELEDPVSDKEGNDSHNGEIIVLYLSNPDDAEAELHYFADKPAAFVAAFYLSEENVERFYDLARQRFEDIQ